MPDSFISEIFYISSAASTANPEFIEIALSPDDDPADFVVSFYDTDGNLETNSPAQGAVNGEVRLSDLVGVPDPDNPNWIIYTIESTSGDGRLLNGGNGNNDLEANYVALTDTSTDPNTVVDGYGIGTNVTETVNGGEADGATLDPSGTHSGNTSVKFDYLGNRTDTGVEGTAHTDNDAIVPCFVTGSRILTASGERNIEDLRVGDLLKTADGRYEPIRWIGKKNISPRHLRNNPRLRPILIWAGALGKNLPKQDLVVSPQHRMVVRSKISERMFGPMDVLVAAKRLLVLPGIDVIINDAPITYYHVLLDNHEVIFANGAPTESLLVGVQAMRAMSDDQREEIESLLPGAFEAANCNHVVPSNKKQNNLMSRHAQNKKSIYS